MRSSVQGRRPHHTGAKGGQSAIVQELACRAGRTGEQEQHARHVGRGGDAAGEGEAAPGRRAAGQGRLVAEASYPGTMLPLK